MNTSKSLITRGIALGAVLVVALGALAYTLAGKKASAPSAAATTNAALPAASGTTFKDGTYSATGDYLSPGGDEKLGVQVTLKDDVITAASITPMPVSPEGQRFQAVFSQNFQPLVVGKKISDVQLGAVSGSSLTPKGFNEALAQIEQQAKA